MLKFREHHIFIYVAGRSIIQCEANVSHVVVQSLVDCPAKVLSPGEVSAANIENMYSI